MPPSLKLLHLYQSPKTSGEFERDFTKILESDEYRTITGNPNDPGLERLVDFLDEVLQSENLSTSLAQKASYALWSICGQLSWLPGSYKIPVGDPHLKAEPEEFASGGFARVFRGEIVGGNSQRRTACLKRIKFVAQEGKDGKERREKAFYKEVAVWMQLKHPNIVECLGATIEPKQIVMELMENGRVMNYLEEKKDPSACRTRLVFGVAKGLDYLHSRGVVHGDLKPQNILVNAKGDACLADFGNSIIENPSGGGERKARDYSPMYAAPETRDCGWISKEADVFSYGLVAFEIYKGKQPWGQVRQEVIMTNLVFVRRPCLPEDAEERGLTTEVWNCIEKCWRQEPAERATISEVIARLSPTTRAESVTLHASESSIGGATGSTARNSTSTWRRPSGPDTHAQQPSGSQVSFRPETPGHQQQHQPNGPPDPMGEVGVRNEGSSSSNERVTPASHLNAAPAHEEHKSSGRWKRFLKRCKTIFPKGVRPTSRLSCKYAKGGMSM
ncbi:kinase-like domain-containing protein [Thelephora terrestris]|uniref:Kinase-like domain-containing protein n=1 Tax=Thelephora terrestris TaxID=56493 RepID=A0A9P6L9J6_9AGAM|nr:kinase-like domain-containing protein [Thelephora terrestris]